jgi:hypothetical protein
LELNPPISFIIAKEKIVIIHLDLRHLSLTSVSTNTGVFAFAFCKSFMAIFAKIGFGEPPLA